MKEDENRRRYDQLVEAKTEIQTSNEEKINVMIESHEIEKKKREDEYKEKTDADEIRF